MEVLLLVDIRPFFGVRYSEEAGDISSLLTLPYDVISSNEQDEYYKRNEHNIIRLDFGKGYPKDNAINNKYTRARSFFRTWLSKGILKRELEESIYVYRQDFTLAGGARYSRKGFMALLKIEDDSENNVKPHEKTLSKPKEDRLFLLRECEAIFSPIFGFYNGKSIQIAETMDRIISNQEPLIQFSDDKEITHLLWRTANRDAITIMRKEMQDRRIFIADGHHRFETARRYRDEMIQKTSQWTGDEPYHFVLTMFVNMHEEGLVILPIHRGIKTKPIDEEDLLSSLSGYFYCEKYSFQDLTEKDKCQKEMRKKLQETYEKKEIAFGIYLGSHSLYLIKAKRSDFLREFLSNEEFHIYGDLDVMVLQKIILEGVLGLDEGSIQKDEEVVFISKDIEEAIKIVDEGECSMVFLLNPTSIEQIIRVASKDKVLPPKSTFFYPKLLTGLVLYDFHSQEGET